MDKALLVGMFLIFLRVMIPLAMVLSFIIFIKPDFFMGFEKKLSIELGHNKLNRKTIEILEKENLIIQSIMVKNNRITGLLCFLLSLAIITKIF